MHNVIPVLLAVVVTKATGSAVSDLGHLIAPAYPELIQEWRAQMGTNASEDAMKVALEKVAFPRPLDSALGSEPTAERRFQIYRGMLLLTVAYEMDKLEPLRRVVERTVVCTTHPRSERQQRYSFGFTFSMIIRHSRLVWASIQRIAEEGRSVDPAFGLTAPALARHLGWYGIVGRVPWFEDLFGKAVCSGHDVPSWLRFLA